MSNTPTINHLACKERYIQMSKCLFFVPQLFPFYISAICNYWVTERGSSRSQHRWGKLRVAKAAICLLLYVWRWGWCDFKTISVLLESVLKVETEFLLTSGANVNKDYRPHYIATGRLKDLQCPSDRDNIWANLILAKLSRGQWVEDIKNSDKVQQKRQQNEW